MIPPDVSIFILQRNWVLAGRLSTNTEVWRPGSHTQTPHVHWWHFKIIHNLHDAEPRVYDFKETLANQKLEVRWYETQMFYRNFIWCSASVPIFPVAPRGIAGEKNSMGPKNIFSIDCNTKWNGWEDASHLKCGSLKNLCIVDFSVVLFKFLFLKSFSKHL